MSGPELVFGFSLLIIFCTSDGVAGLKNRLFGSETGVTSFETDLPGGGMFLARVGPISVKYLLKPLAMSVLELYFLLLW